MLLFVMIACVNGAGVVFGCITVLFNDAFLWNSKCLYCVCAGVRACMCVCLLGFAEQQPRLSSIGRDRNELQKKIAKLEKQREQYVSAGKLSDVCTLVVCCIL